ncbi:hypothetical protein AB2N08_03080 [Massilia aurea]|uniref:hypothetical protein n=1 Tax=Massilia aurea TaxID=373040 RepID=UPI00346258E6
MSAAPISPRLRKGALIGVDLFNPLASVVAFQYNPDTMTRKLEARGVNADGERGEAFRLAGPPRETITLALDIDATDQLADGNALALASGITPTLAALEMMLYPKSALVIANSILSAVGTVEILPAEGPMILFVWGPTRVLPVRLGSLSIVEEAYDANLNPTRAKVDLTLNVLSYNDLQFLSAGNALFMVHQIAKEVLATANFFNNASDLGAVIRP